MSDERTQSHSMREKMWRNAAGLTAVVAASAVVSPQATGAAEFSSQEMVAEHRVGARFTGDDPVPVFLEHARGSITARRGAQSFFLQVRTTRWPTP